jgi:hypothetical protein
MLNYYSIFSILVFVAVIYAESDSAKFLTAGDASLFKADPKIVEIKENNLNSTSYGWTEYKQCDSRWANEQLGTCSSTTICSAGCAMSSVAMILATKGCSYTPSTLNSWLKSHGGKIKKYTTEYYILLLSFCLNVNVRIFWRV